MCFSAEASFLVSGTLLAVGVATVSKTVNRKDLPLALIPFIFSIQQLIEGILWLSLADNNPIQSQYWLSNLYGIFIGVIWPLFAPLAILCTETDTLRRRIIAAIGIAGLLLALYTITGLTEQPVTAGIINHSIQYRHEVAGYQFVIVLYLLATCAPFLISSYRTLNIAGIIITAGFFIAYFAYYETFASVWCFFAAMTSALIYSYFIQRIKKPLISAH